MLVGLIGGIASGKSEVARRFARLGAVTIDADQIGHQVLRQSEVKSTALARWGTRVFGENGEISRAALAAIVFGESPSCAVERKFLTQLTHPRIRSEIERQVAITTASDARAIILLDAPVLLEAGWDPWCDHLIFVDAPREIRQARASARGWSQEQFTARELSQVPIEEKRQRANWVVHNGGSYAELEADVSRVWAKLQENST